MDSSDVAFNLEYYQPTFLWIMDAQSNAIRRALIDEPLIVRRSFFASFPPGTVFHGAEGHARLREYLSVLKAAIQSKLKHHSLPFWLHIYRRIGPFLSPSHENKRDALTVRLVRDIVECAIAKYGDLSNTRDIKRSKNVPAELILGGHFLRRLKPFIRDRAKREDYIKQLRASDQLVLCDFGAADLVTIYGVEGLAYEYWLTTARLRSIGKGDRQVLDAEGNLIHEANADLDFLITSFDSRLSRYGTMSMLAGTFLLSAEIGRSGSGKIFTPAYNAEQDRTEELLSVMGFPSDHSPTPILNFLPMTISIASIVESHLFLSQRFLESRGYSLKLYLLVLAGLSWRAVMPERRLVRLLEGDKTAISFALLQVLRRAYAVVDPDPGSILESVRWYMQNWIGADSVSEPLTDDAIADIIRDLTLDDDAKQSRISLWTRGPRSVLLRTKDMAIIDTQGIIQLLETLFVGLRHSE